MTGDTSPVDPTPGPGLKRWWAVAVIVPLIGVGFLTAGLLGHNKLASPAMPQPSAAMAQPPASGHPSAARTVTPYAAPASKPPAKKVVRRAGPIAGSAPVTLRIPAIGVSLRLSTLGLNPNGTVQVPVKDQAPGWFRLGPTPGQMGSAVILGHVDDYKGPAAFYQLRALHQGDTVDVGLADGRVAHFAVRTVASYLKTQFPAQQVYGTHGYPALQLVTCGGQFNPATGHYLSNLVAYTSLVSTTPAGAR